MNKRLCILFMSAVSACVDMMGAVHAGESTEFCRELDKFDENPRESRWVELRWIGEVSENANPARLECLHSQDLVSTDFCDWLTSHSSFEFEGVTPREILECRGYVFPSRRAWTNWSAEISIKSTPNYVENLIIDQSIRVKSYAYIKLSIDVF